MKVFLIFDLRNMRLYGTESGLLILSDGHCSFGSVFLGESVEIAPAVECCAPSSMVTFPYMPSGAIFPATEECQFRRFIVALEDIQIEVEFTYSKQLRTWFRRGEPKLAPKAKGDTA